MKSKILIVLLSTYCMLCPAQNDNYSYVPLKGLVSEIYDITTIRSLVIKNLYEIPQHVGFEEEINDEIRDSLLNEINIRNIVIDKDTLFTSDVFYLYKPYLDWLRYIDPHYRVFNYNVLSDSNGTRNKQLKHIKNKRRYLPFNLLNINDTLIVKTSTDTDFRKGDIILSINNIPTSELLKYNYRDRHTSPLQLLSSYYSKELVDNYSVCLLRDHDTICINTSGCKNYNSLKVELNQKESMENSICVYNNIGYISIPKFFPDNSRLIKILDKSLYRFKAEGCENVILDLRGNPGGYGDSFDILLSLLINKKSIPYMRAQYIKENGAKREMSTNEYTPTIPLDNTRYIDGLTYYVLMDEGTASIAASLCNILQYNDAATLVGEPLLHNALKYGETLSSNRKIPLEDLPGLFKESGVSIVEFDEYTEAKDGYLCPDIKLSYSAADYLNGEDGMLNQLLTLISNNYE